MNLKQKKILKKLVLVNAQRYSQLYKGFSEEDKFPYHLKYLQKKKYINKRDNRYYITKDGVRASISYDIRTLQDDNIATVRLAQIVKYKDLYYINNHFDQDPNTSRYFYMLPSVKPVLGLTLEDSCNQIFKAKSSIDAQFRYRCTFHYINRTTNNDVLFDTIFLVYETEISYDEYVKSNPNKWFGLKELKALKNKSIMIDTLLLEDSKEVYLQETVFYNYGFEDKDI